MTYVSMPDMLPDMFHDMLPIPITPYPTRVEQTAAVHQSTHPKLPLHTPQ